MIALTMTRALLPGWKDYTELPRTWIGDLIAETTTPLAGARPNE